MPKRYYHRKNSTFSYYAVVDPGFPKRGGGAKCLIFMTRFRTLILLKFIALRKRLTTNLAILYNSIQCWQALSKVWTEVVCFSNQHLIGRLIIGNRDFNSDFIIHVVWFQLSIIFSLWLAMSSSNGWYWYDKEPYLYTNWQPGQPSTEDVCAVASLDTENSQWRVEDCLFTHGVACKVPKR